MKNFCKVIISLFFLQIGFAEDKALTGTSAIHPDNVVRAYFPNKQIAAKLLISHHNFLLESHLDEGYLVFDLPPSEQKILSEFNISLQADKDWVLRWKIKRANLLKSKKLSSISKNSSALISSTQAFSCYPTVEETYQQAQQLADDNPTIAEWIDIGNSYEKDANLGGFDIRVLKLTNKQNTAEKPVLFIHGAMHAREMTPGMLTLDFAKMLIDGYGIDADLTWILDQQEVHIIFLLNPDARKKAEQVIFWRKNTNQNYCSPTSEDRGADLNRNFSFFWNQDGVVPAPSSGNVCDATYRGPTAASEPEVQALESYIRSIFVDSRGPLDSDGAALDTPGMHIDIHSYSELVLWPWGHTNAPSANDLQFRTLARRLAAFNGYSAMRSIGLYPTDGTSDNVSYGELGVAAFTFELGSEFFETCTSYEANVKDRNLEALLYAAKVTSAPYTLPAGPTASGLQLVSNSSISTTLSVLIDDNQFLRATPGPEPRNNITAAEYSIDLPFNSAQANSISMTVADGNLNSFSETMNADIDTSQLAAGRHIIYVRGQDDSATWGPTSAIFLDIGNLNPIVKISVNCIQLDCSFDASNSTDDGSIVSYLWDFGDGSSANGVTANHSYVADAAHTIVLTLNDDLGATEVLSREIKPGTPYQPPVVSFSVSCNGQSCQFDGSSSTDADGNITEYHWNFGDGQTATGISANHNYQRLGNLQVSLTAIDDNNLAGAESKSLVITAQATTTSSSGGGGGGSIYYFGFLLLLMYGFVGSLRKS